MAKKNKTNKNIKRKGVLKTITAAAVSAALLTGVGYSAYMINDLSLRPEQMPPATETPTPETKKHKVFVYDEQRLLFTLEAEDGAKISKPTLEQLELTEYEDLIESYDFYYFNENTNSISLFNFNNEIKSSVVLFLNVAVKQPEEEEKTVVVRIGEEQSNLTYTTAEELQQQLNDLFNNLPDFEAEFFVDPEHKTTVNDFLNENPDAELTEIYVTYYQAQIVIASVDVTGSVINHDLRVAPGTLIKNVVVPHIELATFLHFETADGRVMDGNESVQNNMRAVYSFEYNEEKTLRIVTYTGGVEIYNYTGYEEFLNWNEHFDKIDFSYLLDSQQLVGIFTEDGREVGHAGIPFEKEMTLYARHVNEGQKFTLNLSASEEEQFFRNVKISIDNELYEDWSNSGETQFAPFNLPALKTITISMDDTFTNGQKIRLRASSFDLNVILHNLQTRYEDGKLLITFSNLYEDASISLDFE